MDQFREVSVTSWGRRIKNAIFGVVIGLVLFVGAFPLLIWNEGRSVDRIRTLEAGRGLVVPVGAEQIDPANEGKLVHFSGMGKADAVLADPAFGVSEQALKLRRVVEMYQWQEKQKTNTTQNVGGSETTETVYSYKKTWSQRLINSSNFRQRAGHENPESMPYKSETFAAPDIHVGGFQLGNDFVRQMNDYSRYTLTQQNVDAMDSRFRNAFKLHNNYYYYGSPSSPQIGALRVNYEVIRPSQFSIIGKQNAQGVETYFLDNGNIALLETGRIGADGMFESAENENALITWLVRAGGIFMMAMGLIMIMTPLRVLSDVVPFIGSLVGAGIGLIAFTTAFALGFTTIALSWLFFRPLVGGALLVLAGLVLFGGGKKIRQRMRQNKAHASTELAPNIPS